MSRARVRTKATAKILTLNVSIAVVIFMTFRQAAKIKFANKAINLRHTTI